MQEMLSLTTRSTHRHTGITRTAMCAAALLALLVPTGLAPTAALAAPQSDDTSISSSTSSRQGGSPAAVTVLADGLDGTSGADLGPDGALYVTEATLGRITRVDTRTGEKSVYASGLPPAVIGLGGAIDIAFVGRTAYVLVTLVGPDVGGDQVSGIYRVDDADSFTVIADLGAFSRANPPATQFDIPSGLQFALEPVRGGFLVTDGHHNRVLHVSKSGYVRELVAFDNIVPTGLAVSGRTVYMGEAGPVPHAPEDGKVVRFSVGKPVARTVASGFSLIVDVELNRCGRLFALSQGDEPGDVPAGSPALPDSGELLKVTKNGTFQVIAAGLDLPTSVDFGRRAAYVVAGDEVLRITGGAVSGKRGGCWK